MSVFTASRILFELDSEENARNIFNPVSAVFSRMMNGLCSVTVSIEACGASGPGSSPGIGLLRLRPEGTCIIFDALDNTNTSEGC